jgi:hypothetical protein
LSSARNTSCREEMRCIHQKQAAQQARLSHVRTVLRVLLDMTTNIDQRDGRANRDA